MDGGAAAFLDKASKCLDVIVVDATPANAEPFAFAGAHEVQCHVRVLEMFVRLDGIQIRAAENETVRAEWIGKGIVREVPAFHVIARRNVR